MSDPSAEAAEGQVHDLETALMRMEVRAKGAEARVAELERAMAEFQTSPEMAACWAGIGRETERAAVVGWLRAEAKRASDWSPTLTVLHRRADAIERGDHLKREGTDE